MDELTLDALLAKITSGDAEVRTQAWLAAGSVGAPAIKPLAAVMRRTEPVVARLAEEVEALNQAPKKDKQKRKALENKTKELEVALESGRAAKRGMWKIVRTVGAPGHEAQQKAVVVELLDLVGPGQPDAVRREVFWMLSEIGADETVEAVREHDEILDEKVLREDARCMVERIPGGKAVELLGDALKEAPDDFKTNVAQSLRARGVDVDGHPCQKLVPTKQTSVKPVGR